MSGDPSGIPSALKWITAFLAAVYREAVDLVDRRPEMVNVQPATGEAGRSLQDVGVGTHRSL